jgi:hypothetical protein
MSSKLLNDFALFPFVFKEASLQQRKRPGANNSARQKSLNFFHQAKRSSASRVHIPVWLPAILRAGITLLLGMEFRVNTGGMPPFLPKYSMRELHT